MNSARFSHRRTPPTLSYGIPPSSPFPTAQKCIWRSGKGGKSAGKEEPTSSANPAAEDGRPSRQTTQNESRGGRPFQPLPLLWFLLALKRRFRTPRPPPIPLSAKKGSVSFPWVPRPLYNDAPPPPSTQISGGQGACLSLSPKLSTLHLRFLLLSKYSRRASSFPSVSCC